MLTGIIPRRLKDYVRHWVRGIVDEQKPQSSLFYHASHPNSDQYLIADIGVPLKSEMTGLAVPPVDLRAGYGPATDTEGRAYTESGRVHVENMAQALSDADFDISTAKRILEFGCAAGRMLCHIPNVAPQGQYWGTDISAEHIRWCRHHLSPPMNFAVTTKIPHLPFRDAFFDLVYCGSVFTHIEDLEEAWLLELGRILEPGGRLYFTIHDEHTIELLDSISRNVPLAKQMMETVIYTNNRTDFRMIVVGRGAMSQVFYNSDYIRSIVPPIFRWLSHTPAAYGYQSAIVLERNDA